MKKQYKSVECELSGENYAVLLDRTPALTPLGTPYIIKSKALAQAIAAEWQAQGDVIVKNTMPLCQLACVALDMAAKNSGELCADILPYAETDLVCYRAGDIPALAQKQTQLLDPVIGWAEAAFGIALKIADGVMPVRQPPENKVKLLAVLSGLDEWKLAALAVAVKSLGSFVLGLALVKGRMDAQTAFTLSHLDEAYETEQWGADEEKDKRLHLLRQEIANVERLLFLCLSS